MNPEPNNTTSSPRSPLKLFWIVLLSVAVLAGFSATGYLLLTGANQEATEAPLDSLSEMETMSQTGDEPLSEGVDIEREKPIIASTPNLLDSGEVVDETVTQHPTRKKTLEDYWQEFLNIFQKKTFRLDGVMTGKPPRVMINRQIVFIGGEIDGARIVQATPQQIILDYEGEEYTLKLGETIKP